LQFLQWQKRQRGVAASRWVLKSPAHLGYLDTLRARFPDLHVVHMHRDPRETIPSGASLNATLHAMHADNVDRDRVGAEWLQRMGWTNDRAMAARAGWSDEAARCTDVEFADAVADPIAAVARVYDSIDLAMTDEAEAAMRQWLIERPREPARPPYSAEDFGLTGGQIDERFATYNSRFRTGATPTRRM
jgi:Sulfotransferase family